MITLKITIELLNEIRSDLARPHTYAMERVGFIRTRYVPLEHNKLILCTSYHPVLDEQYIDDHYSGARINSTAIRGAMQLALDTHDGIFHIHEHYGKRTPGFSRMDMNETPRIVQALQNIESERPHGMIVINPASAFGLVQLPGDTKLQPIEKIVVIGSPMKIIQ